MPQNERDRALRNATATDDKKFATEFDFCFRNLDFHFGILEFFHDFFTSLIDFFLDKNKERILQQIHFHIKKTSWKIKGQEKLF